MFYEEDSMTDISPPHSIESEEALIGAVLINPDAYNEVEPIIKEPTYFYIIRNQWVWQAFARLLESGLPIDFLTVTEELDKMGHLEDIGGASYITKLVNNVPSSLHAKAYALRVAETWERREGLALANRIARDAYNEDKDFSEAKLTHAAKLTETSVMGEGAVHIDTWLSDGYDYLEERSKNPTSHAGISTGLGDLDRVFGDGLLPGANLLLGPPGYGKTILAQQITVNIAKDKVPTAFYSGEMYWRDMYLRFMSGQAKQKVSNMRKGEIDFPLITKAMEEMGKYPLWVDDPKGMTTSELRADLIRLKSEHGIKVMVFDYLGKLVDNRGKMEEWKRTPIISVRLQEMLVELDIAGLIIHQTTKDGYKKQDLAGIAGGVGVAYEVVCAVQIELHEEDNLRKIVNIKPPRGVEGYWKYTELWKDPLYPRFELAKKEEPMMYKDHTV